MLVLPILFGVVYATFFGFILGDWSWYEHAMSWPGEWGIVWRTVHAVIFTLGILSSFVFGLQAHD